MRTDQIDNPNEADIAQVAAHSRVARMRTAFPAIVIRYNRATNSADVRPVLRGKRFDPVERETVSFRMRSIPDVPINWPVGQLGGSTYPLKDGDSVLIVCAERSIDEWKQIGGVGVDDITPADPRRFDLSDAFIVGGVRGLNDPLPTDATADDGPVFWTPNGFVYLGDSTASDFVALASLVVSELNSMRTWLAAHTHIGVTTGVGTSGIPAVVPPVVGSVAADKVKAT